MTKPCEVLKPPLLFTCLAASGMLAGCRPQIETPVWLKDSSGVVVGGEFVEINGKVARPTFGSIPEAATEKAHPKTRQMASLQVHVDRGTARIGEFSVATFNGKAEVNLRISRLETPATPELKESLSFIWEGKDNCPLDQNFQTGPVNDLYWSPDGGHLVLSLGEIILVVLQDKIDRLRFINIIIQIHPEVRSPVLIQVIIFCVEKIR